MLIKAILIVWMILGYIGYVLMHHGFRCVATKKYEDLAWPLSCQLFGIVCMFLGPIFIIISFIVHGKNCFKEIPERPEF